MAPSYRQILDRADAHFSAVDRAQPDSLNCRQGCSICCHGFFEISAADVALIADGLGTLPSADRIDLVARAESAMLSTGHPRLREGNVEETELFFARTDSLPCPALSEDGACRIYDHRPLVCRTFGLPLRDGRKYLGQECELNFKKASPEEKEQAAWDLQWEDELGPEDEFTVAEAIVLAGRMNMRP